MNEEHCENDLNDVVYAEPSLGVDAEEDFGEDFDDFEAGAIDEDFGEFNENFQEPSIPGDNEPGLQEAGMSSSGQFSSTSPFVSRSTGQIRIHLHNLRFLLPMFMSVTDHHAPTSRYLISAKLIL